MTNPKEIKFKQLAILKRNLMDLQVQAAKFPQNAAELQPKIDYVQEMIAKIELGITQDDERRQSRAGDRYDDKREAEKAAAQAKIDRAKQIEEARRSRMNGGNGGGGGGGGAGGGEESFRGITQSQWQSMDNASRKAFLQTLRSTGFASDGSPVGTDGRRPWWMILGPENKEKPEGIGARSFGGGGGGNGSGPTTAAQKIWGTKYYPGRT